MTARGFGKRDYDDEAEDDSISSSNKYHVEWIKSDIT